MAKGREVPPAREICRHAWVIVSQDAETVMLDCEFCNAGVMCKIGHHAAGHMFGFAAFRGAVSVGDLRELGEWFGRQVGERPVHIDLGSSRRRRRRSPGRAA